MLKPLYRTMQLQVTSKRISLGLLSFRSLATYTIETSLGIYQIQEKSNIQKDSSLPRKETLPPDIFEKDVIEFYTLRGGDGAVRDLVQLQKIEKHLKLQDKKFLKGYVHDDNYGDNRHHGENEFNGDKGHCGESNGDKGQCGNDDHNGYNLQKSFVFIGDSPSKTPDTDNIFKEYKLQKTTLYRNDCSDRSILRRKNENDSEENDGDVNHFEMTRYLDTHPIVLSRAHRPVYKSYEQALAVIRKLSELNISPEITEFGNRRIKELTNIDKKLKHPFIVVEGLDGTGKSTMTKNLSNYLNAVSLATPPDSIRHIRKEFDNLPELCRRSFYAFSNYLASCEVSRATDESTVVLDRYWHSTTAYALAKEAAYGSTEHLPHPQHEVYKWPTDLLKPSAIVFLTTPEQDRDARVNERDEMTTEEAEIAENKKLRQRITECYRRIGFCTWIEVDTSGSQKESLRKVVHALKENNVIP